MKDGRSDERKVSFKAILIVVIMLACALTPLASTFNGVDHVSADSHIGDSTHSQKRYYMTLGDSLTSGYCTFDYYIDANHGTYSPSDLFLRYPADNDISAGLHVKLPYTYPAFIEQKLNETRYLDSEWELVPAAITGIRMDELRFLLDDDFYAQYPAGCDGYMPNDSLVYALKNWAKFTHNDDHEIASTGEFCQTCMTEFREYYKDLLSEASFITLHLGMNNFGAFMERGIKSYLSGDDPYECYFNLATYLGDDSLAQRIIDSIFDTLIYEMLVARDIVDSITPVIAEAREAVELYRSDPQAAKEMVADYISVAVGEGDWEGISTLFCLLETAGTGFSEWAKDYRESLMERYEELTTGESTTARLVQFIRYIAEAITYAVVGHNVNYDICIDWIFENCKENPRIMVLGKDNAYEDLSLSLDILGTTLELPLGKMYGIGIDLINQYSEYLSPHSTNPRVSYVAPPDLHRYNDQLAEDSPLSAEYWFQILRQMNRYYLNDGEEPGYTDDRLQSVYLILQDMNDSQKGFLADYGVFTRDDQGFNINVDCVLTPGGLETLSEAIHALLDSMVSEYGLDGISQIEGLRDCIEVSPAEPVPECHVIESLLDTFIEVTGGHPDLEDMNNLAKMVLNTGDLSEELHIIENGLRRCHEHNVVPVSILLEGETPNDIFGKLVKGEELSDGECALFNFDMVTSFANMIGSHPDDKGHQQNYEACWSVIEPLVVQDAITMDIVDCVAYINEGLGTGEMNLNDAIGHLKTGINAIFEKYGDSMDAKMLYSALEGAVDVILEENLHGNIVDTIQKYIEGTPDRLRDFALMALEKIEDGIKRMLERFGEGYGEIVDRIHAYLISLMEGNDEPESCEPVYIPIPLVVCPSIPDDDFAPTQPNPDSDYTPIQPSISTDQDDAVSDPDSDYTPIQSKPTTGSANVDADSGNDDSGVLLLMGALVALLIAFVAFFVIRR